MCMNRLFLRCLVSCCLILPDMAMATDTGECSELRSITILEQRIAFREAKLESVRMGMHESRSGLPNDTAVLSKQIAEMTRVRNRYLEDLRNCRLRQHRYPDVDSASPLSALSGIEAGCPECDQVAKHLAELETELGNQKNDYNLFREKHMPGRSNKSVSDLGPQVRQVEKLSQAYEDALDYHGKLQAAADAAKIMADWSARRFRQNESVRGCKECEIKESLDTTNPALPDPEEVPDDGGWNDEPDQQDDQNPELGDALGRPFRALAWAAGGAGDAVLGLIDDIVEGLETEFIVPKEPRFEVRNPKHEWLNNAGVTPGGLGLSTVGRARYAQYRADAFYELEVVPRMDEWTAAEAALPHYTQFYRQQPQSMLSPMRKFEANINRLLNERREALEQLVDCNIKRCRKKPETNIHLFFAGGSYPPEQDEPIKQPDATAGTASAPSSGTGAQPSDGVQPGTHAARPATGEPFPAVHEKSPSAMVRAPVPHRQPQFPELKPVPRQPVYSKDGFISSQPIFPNSNLDMPRPTFNTNAEPTASERDTCPIDPESICEKLDPELRASCNKHLGAVKRLCQTISGGTLNPAQCVIECDENRERAEANAWLYQAILKTVERALTDERKTRSAMADRFEADAAKAQSQLEELEPRAAKRTVYIYVNTNNGKLVEHSGNYFEPKPPLVYKGKIPGHLTPQEYAEQARLKGQIEQKQALVDGLRSDANLKKWQKLARKKWGGLISACPASEVESGNQACKTRCGVMAVRANYCNTHIIDEMTWEAARNYLYPPGHPGKWWRMKNMDPKSLIGGELLLERIKKKYQ